MTATRAGRCALIIVPIVIGISIAVRSVYFVGTDDSGFVSVYQGLPYDLPAGVEPVPRAVRLRRAARRRSRPPRARALLDHKLRSERDADDLVSSSSSGSSRDEAPATASCWR